MISPPEVRFYGIFNNWVEIFCVLRAMVIKPPHITNHVYAHASIYYTSLFKCGWYDSLTGSAVSPP